MSKLDVSATQIHNFNVDASRPMTIGEVAILAFDTLRILNRHGDTGRVYTRSRSCSLHIVKIEVGLDPLQ